MPGDPGDQGDPGVSGVAGDIVSEGKCRRSRSHPDLRIPAAGVSSVGKAHRLQISSDEEVHKRIKWKVSFSEIGTLDLKKGRIVYHPESRWLTLRDEEDDILAGHYLQEGDRISEGAHFLVDVFSVVCVSHILQRLPIIQDQQPIDVSSDEEERDKHRRNLPRVGGKFWVLAEEDIDEVAQKSSPLQALADLADKEEEVPACAEFESPAIEKPVNNAISPLLSAAKFLERRHRTDFKLMRRLFTGLPH